MQCPYCGSPLADGSRFCPYCGSRFDEAPGEDRRAGPEIAPEVREDEPERSGDGGLIPAPPPSADPMRDPRGMKWFKFIIYFQLFANAALNLFNAFQLFTGAHYMEYAEEVYRAYPGLKSADLTYGAACLGLAALAIFARFRLAGFRRNGPGLYYALQVASVAVALVYLFLAGAAMGQPVSELLDGNVLVTILSGAFLLIVNMIYFGKRMDLFVN